MLAQRIGGRKEEAFYHLFTSGVVNRNSFFGLLGITLLTFAVAFMVGRWTRPVRPMSSSPALPVAATSSALASEELTTSDSAADRVLDAMQADTLEEEPEGPRSAPVRPVGPPSRLKAATKPGSPKASTPQPAKPAVRVATAATKPVAAPLAAITDTTTIRPAATEAIAPKPVIAKDYVAIEERQNYASQLPKELLDKGIEAKVNVVGELAEVIILSSPSFDERSKDTVIKQVCINLKSLGFKRVHLTDGGSYTSHFGL